jgi:hypothetical protein
MKMSFAGQTLRAIRSGDTNERVTAVLRYVSLFALATFIASSLISVLNDYASQWWAVALGATISAFVGHIKFGQ